MILRGATISEQRRSLALESEQPLESLAEQQPSRNAVRELDARRSAANDSALAQLVSGEPAPIAPLPQLQEPELSFERVAAWLAVQDADTRKACASILSDELTHVHEAAKAEGHAIGKIEGRKLAEHECEHTLVLLQSICEQAETAFEREQEQLVAASVEVIGEAFAKLAGAALAEPRAIVAVVCEVLKRAREARELVVRVNARDLPVVQAQEPALRAAVAGRSISLAVDARVEVGGCIVESSLGSLDGRLEVQLRALYETLKVAKALQAESSP